MTAAALRAAFGSVDAWVFDLDNTLYPAHAPLFAQVERRIGQYVQDLLGLPPTEARAVQKDYFHRYGTTLRGLVLEHGISAEAFMHFVHDIDHSVLDPDPALAAALTALPGRRYILTNGSVAHAETTAAALGLAGLFDDIFDIVAADLIPKPNRETYERFIARTGIHPHRAAMFEDLPRNLTVPDELGMRTVLVIPQAQHMPASQPVSHTAGGHGPHIQHVTDDLGDFLGRIVAAISR